MDGPKDRGSDRGDSLVTATLAVRRRTAELAARLEVDDWGAQSMPDASPVKWHLAHTTWFFDRFVLRPIGSSPFDARVADCPNAQSYDYLFNSYYESVGKRQPRDRRGLLTRPTADEVLAYRRIVDARLADLDGSARIAEVRGALELGKSHEEQHQELLLTDAKHLLGQSALLPAYRRSRVHRHLDSPPSHAWHRFEGGLASIGHDPRTGSFSFDNERPRHQVFVAPFEIGSRLVTCGEYLEFIESGGYGKPEHWLSDGWAWCRATNAVAPLYWNLLDRTLFTLDGNHPLELAEPVCHVTYYEADAYARWAGARLLREAEWEVAAARAPAGAAGGLLESDRLHPAPARGDGLAQMIGDAWEWTQSGYEAYPGFRAETGAFAEYNGKFMVSQVVLRGGSCVTPADHIRPSYRNFFPPSAAWQFTGIRLARDVA